MYDLSVIGVLAGPLLLALLTLIIRSLSSNTWIRKRLGLSLFLFIAAALLGVAYWHQRDSLLLHIEGFVVLAAVLMVAVVLALNPFREETISDRYPSIVQDGMVIGVMFLILLYWAPDKFLTTSAVGALIIGLALQDTLGNLFAGLALQIEKPFFVGDWVKLEELDGRVMEVTWRATKIRSRAGTFHIIPNTVIAKGQIVNCTHPSRVVRIDRTIGFSYEIPPNKIKETVLATMAEIPEILKRPAPDVLLDAYNDFSIDYRCRFWIDDFGNMELILDKFSTLLYYRLERTGIKIPFPIRDLRIQRTPAAREKEAKKEQLSEERRQWLAETDLFAPLDSDTLARIAHAMERVTFAKDEPIIHQGESGDSMFFIVRGKVQVVVERHGIMNQVATLQEGQYFGEMALLAGEERSATVIASTDVDTYVLDKGGFGEILSDHPEIAEKISAVIAEREAILRAKSEELEKERPKQSEVQQTLLKKIRRFFNL